MTLIKDGGRKNEDGGKELEKNDRIDPLLFLHNFRPS